MVFEKITLFEPHFDGATFDARFGENDDRAGSDAVDRMDAETTDGDRRRVLVPVLASLTLAAVATVLARRFFGDAASDEQIELDESLERAAD